MAFIFTEPFTLPNAKRADPEKIGLALEQVASEHAGRLHPGDVVEAARSPRSALHPHFEWNDEAAAEAYRLDQARALIRLIRISDEALDEPPRAFLSVKDSDGVSYRRFGDVRESVDLQLAVLKQARVDLAAFRRRYRDLVEICELVQVAEDEVARRLEPSETAHA